MKGGGDGDRWREVVLMVRVRVERCRGREVDVAAVVLVCGLGEWFCERVCSNVCSVFYLT